MPDALVFKPTKQTPRCRNCSHRLEGLIEPRCPECGRGFDPADPRTYSEPLSVMPPWDGSRWFFGWLAALTMGVAATGCLLMLLRFDFREVVWDIGRSPVEFVFLSFPAVGLIRIGFTCRLTKTIAWSALVAIVTVCVVMAVSGSVRYIPEAVVSLLMILSVVAFLLSLGHIFRRWGPFEWFRSTRVQHQSQMHADGRR